MIGSLAEKVIRRYRSGGVRALVRSISRRGRLAMTPGVRLAGQLVAGEQGLEIGGPSMAMFARGGAIPIYHRVGGLDNCNFSGHTRWEGEIDEGNTFRFDHRKPPGRQFILEATQLSGIGDESYDFVLSSHAIEHIANPLKAIREWKRVLRLGGTMVLVIPHRDLTFDRRRPVTTLTHMIHDYHADVGEDDMGHMEEILSLHDFGLEAQADPVEFRASLMNNASDRMVHHHVFNANAVAAMVDFVGLQILAMEASYSLHNLAVCRKPAGGSADNRAFFGPNAPHRKSSPFVSDRD
jgi:SAM-dependent methyltransferase